MVFKKMYQVGIPSSITRPLDTAKRHINGLIVAGVVHGDGAALILGDTKDSGDVLCEDGCEESVLIPI